MLSQYSSVAFVCTSPKSSSTSLSHIACVVASEAEYISSSKATTHAIWLRDVLDDLGEMQTKATLLYCDNMSAIAMTKNQVFHQKTRHINRKIHFVREAVQGSVINMKFCQSEDQVVDIFTKSLPKNIFNQLRSMLGVKPVSTLGGSVE